MPRSIGTSRVAEIVDAAYQELRETIDRMRDKDAPVPSPQEIARLFDKLDDHMKQGRPLPSEWCAYPQECNEE